MNPTELIKKKNSCCWCKWNARAKSLRVLLNFNDVELLATSVEDKLVFENIEYVQSRYI
jgi:hypothetical protein